LRLQARTGRHLGFSIEYRPGRFWLDERLVGGATDPDECVAAPAGHKAPAGISKRRAPHRTQPG